MVDFAIALPKEVCSELGKRARTRRLMLNLSVEELALRVGISDKTLSHFERTGRCTLETFVRILESLNAQPDLAGVLVTRDATLMNNRDDHAKNLAFMLEANGRWHLAPPYDLTYCPGYQGEHFMDIAGEGRAPARQHVLQAALAAGLPSAVAEAAIDEVLALVTPDRFLALAQDLPLHATTVATVHAAMQLHYARLAR